ncbi:zinc finger protein 570-like [Malaya genurostris]|uniref:zinc finger protein 570-like n=1 Tax=Malaya genurostris TaxID=325434 RepID=UPI0026F38700|nr:zinc finger protein 570-like [Malaya genurostris]
MNELRILNRFDLLCRFCLSEEKCVFIFSDKFELNPRLKKCLDVLLSKIDENDGYPNKICENCICCIEQFVDFENTCVKSYDLLETVKYSITIETETESIQHDGETESTTYADVQESTLEGFPNIVIKMNQNEFSSDDTNNEHLEEKEKFDDLTVDINDSQDAVEKEVVEDTSYSISIEQQQLMDAAIVALPCGFVERGNRRIPLMECMYCKNVYRGRNTLKKHLRIHLKIKDYRCTHCPRTFTDRSSLRIHQGRHLGKTFECSYCSKTYFSQNELRQHLTMQHLERKYSCDICERKFPSSTILNDHKRVHLPDRPFICQQCGAGFKRNRNLIRHEQLHQKEIEKSKQKNKCIVIVSTKTKKIRK